MAAHDYARRKPKQKQRKPAVSRWVMLLTLGVSVAFLVALLKLAQEPNDPKASTTVADKNTATEALKVAPQNNAKTADKQAPDPQKGNFDFYTLLPDSKVTPGQVEAYISTPKDPKKKTNIVLQAGSFRKLADANRLRAQLILVNLTDVVAEKTVSSSGSVWFRVRIGPFSNRSTLNKAEDILAQQGIESIRINKSTN